MDLARIKEKTKNHPCYCAGAHMKYSRIHLPVAPACNIQCNYCNRKFDCSNESRPGVTSDVLTPEEALNKTITAYYGVKNLSVVGIAGPGDALANPDETFSTFKLIRKFNEDLNLCLSTNGLALPDMVDEVVKAGINHVTVTVNAVDPMVADKIYDRVRGFERGTGGAAYLLKKQIEGIEKLVSRDVIVKINSVLIPGINDEHIVEVASSMKELGAYIHNIIPLMSKPEYGTKFALDGVPEPDCAMLGQVRVDCGKVFGEDQIMSHCRQCRADAVGILGQSKNIGDLQDCEECVVKNSEIFEEMTEEVKAKIELEMKDTDIDRPIKIAVASTGEKQLDTNFGKAKNFMIYEFSKNGWEHVSVRNVDTFKREDTGRMEAGVSALYTILVDCHGVVYKKIGHGAEDSLKEMGIEPFVGKAYGLSLCEAWKAAKAIYDKEASDKVLVK